MEFEKNRQLQVLLDKYANRDKGVSTNTESEEESQAGTDQDLRGIKNSMSRKKKEEAQLKLASRVHQVGASFPANDPDPSSSDGSGNESDVRTSSKSRRKIRSGAMVKQRPVIKTELWPHTVANEEEACDATSENIFQQKFLKYFTYIMATREPKEAAGRQQFLYAITSVLDCLPWPEARTFHNLVMVKLEQGRIGWDEDFSVLANQFLDRKLRQTLKTRSQPASGGSNYRGGYRGTGRNYRGSNPRGESGRNKWVYCKQWNEGTCSYGINCKRWHVCCACGEAGKLGERHKSSSSDCPKSK